jgi:hypothetical protein
MSDNNSLYLYKCLTSLSGSFVQNAMSGFRLRDRLYLAQHHSSTGMVQIIPGSELLVRSPCHQHGLVPVLLIPARCKKVSGRIS